MSDLSAVRLKAGVLAGALRMPQSTVRSLIGAGLMLGRRQSHGHPDYSLADVFRVKLLEVLRTNFGMDGPRSIYVVNHVFDDLAKTVSGHFNGASARSASLVVFEGFYKADGFKMCHVAPDPAALSDLLEAYGFAHQRGFTVVPLKGVMSGAILSLGKVLHGDWEVCD